MRYRKDIDGLRALAVVPVVLFHADIGPFTGGFVGVDVFFVISGYLITDLIVQELSSGRFSIANFYERRIRRIVPALSVIVVFCAVAATKLLLPDQYDLFARSVLATALFSSNFLFRLESGYFALPSTEKPLLHTWSLAVEEQFYIFFPWVLFIIHRWLGGRWIPWLAGIAVACFALNIWATTHDPRSAFYLLPYRGWELLLGALLAVEAFPILPRRWLRELAGLAGLGLIAWSVVTLDSESVFPGWNVLPPVAGAALVVWSGDGGESAVSSVLSAPPLVFVGLVSYSLYLWHWPLFVFAEQWRFDPLTLGEKTVVVLLSFGLAVVSWRTVEVPLRRRGPQALVGRRAMFAGTAVVAVCFLAFGVVGYLSQGWPSRMPPDVLALAAYSRSMDPRIPTCRSSRARGIPPKDACVFGASTPPKYVLWGDSHATTLPAMLGSLAGANGESGPAVALGACPPLLGVRIETAKTCLDRNEEVARYISASSSIEVVMLMARWALYLEGANLDFGPAERRSRDRLFLEGPNGEDVGEPERQRLFADAVNQTVARLRQAGKKVVVVNSVPETGYDIPPTLAHLALLRREPSSFTSPKEYYLRRQAFISSVFESLEAAGEITLIRPDSKLCDEDSCIVYANGKSLYRDDDHLSLAGADFISSLFAQLFEDDSVGAGNSGGR